MLADERKGECWLSSSNIQNRTAEGRRRKKERRERRESALSSKDEMPAKGSEAKVDGLENKERTLSLLSLSQKKNASQLIEK